MYRRASSSARSGWLVLHWEIGTDSEKERSLVEMTAVSLSHSSTWIVMPAFNAEATLERTFRDLPDVFQDRVILVDDGSGDRTVELADELGLEVVCHVSNKGYGANQKTCYRAALERGAQIVIMVHPDYQYDSRLTLVMAELIRFGTCDMVLGNRIRTRREALDGGMPKWKYFVNRTSTFVENFILGQSLGDFHSGFRAYSRELLETIPFENNSDDFAFDQELLVQAVAAGFKIGDIPVPVRYLSESSSIGLRRSMTYGLGGIRAVGAYYLTKWGLLRDPRFLGLSRKRKRPQ